MKILLVHDYASLAGGAELQMLALRDRLRDLGHDARLFATTAGPPPYVADYTCFGTSSRFRGLVQAYNPAAGRALNTVLKEFRPDVVQVSMFLTQLSPSILPMLKNVPAMYYAVWYRAICPIGTKLLPDLSVCNFKQGAVCYRQGCVPMHDWLPLMGQLRLLQKWRGVLNKIVAVSHTVASALEREGFEDVNVISPGVPETAVGASLSHTPVAVFAGRLVREKGIDVLLRAFSRVHEQMPAARLIVAGEGPEYRNLSDLITRLKLERVVALTGFLDREQMEESFEGAWVQVVPSVWQEPFGIVAAESMMRARPVIASDTGGLRDVVTNDVTGVLVAPGNVEDLANAMFRIFRQRKLAEQMGFAARKSALQRFSVEVSASKFLEAYRSLVR